MSEQRSSICATPSCQRPAVFWDAADPQRGSEAEPLCSVCRGLTAIGRPQRGLKHGLGKRAHEYVVAIMDARTNGTLRPLALETLDCLHAEFGCPADCRINHEGERPTEEEWRARFPKRAAGLMKLHGKRGLSREMRQKLAAEHEELRRRRQASGEDVSSETAVEGSQEAQE